jgi:hypothetical protein
MKFLDANLIRVAPEYCDTAMLASLSRGTLGHSVYSKKW